MSYLKIILIFFLSLAFVHPTQADSIKLKNGSYFDGKITKDAEGVIQMRLDVGMVVEFPREEVVEIEQEIDEEEAKPIDIKGSQSGVDKMPEEIVMSQEDFGGIVEEEYAKDPLEEAREAELEAYLNEGKVKHEGRMISKDVFDVLQKEKEIKKKRHEYLQKKKRQEKKDRERQVVVNRVKAHNEKKDLHITSPNRLGALKSFGTADSNDSGGLRTRTFATAQKESSQSDGSGSNIGGLKKVSTFGTASTKTFATTANAYESKGG